MTNNKIYAFVQSTGYHDMLAITLPLNKAHFDEVIVHTKRGDDATIQVCVKNNVTCIETDLFQKGGSKFNRGAVFNEAFRQFFSTGKELGWFCIMDSDIVLPPDFREKFFAEAIEPECMYGARRYNVETQEQWSEVCKDRAALQKLTLFRGYGYSYLQIFHPLSSMFLDLWRATLGNPYPEWNDGSTADWMFRNFWGDCPWNPPTEPPDHILDHSVPEPCDPPTKLLRKLSFNVVHLGITGINSDGRRTALWSAQSE